MILVTGGTGFIGSTLIHQLLAAGKSVRAIKRPESLIPEQLTNISNLEWVEADLLNYFSLKDAFDQITHVYHCAAMISNQLGDRKQLLKINVEGTAHIVTHSLQAKARLLHVSSIAAIGRPRQGGPSSEKDLWENDGKHSGYSISKYLAEMEVWRGIAEGLDAVIVNPSLVIGKEAGRRGSGAIFHTLKKGIKFYPPGSVGLVDVEDVAKAMVLLMEHPHSNGERYILNSDNLSYQDLFARCSAHFNRPAPHIMLNRAMLGLAWRVAGLFAQITGKAAGITKETARSSQKKLAFSNQKIKSEIGMEFKSIDTTLYEICEKINSNQ